jgi:hypothetical protein
LWLAKKIAHKVEACWPPKEKEKEKSEHKFFCGHQCDLWGSSHTQSHHSKPQIGAHGALRKVGAKKKKLMLNGLKKR